MAFSLSSLKCPYVRAGNRLVVLSVVGTTLAVLLWLAVSLTAGAIVYALTLGAVLLILRRHVPEADVARHAQGTIGIHSETSTD